MKNEIKTESAPAPAGADQVPLMADGPIVFIKTSAGLGQKVAMCQRGDYVGDVDRELASFIVLSCNSHAELLAERDRLKAALQVLRAAISDFGGHGMPGFTDRAEALLAIREADAALAEGGKA